MGNRMYEAVNISLAACCAMMGGLWLRKANEQAIFGVWSLMAGVIGLILCVYDMWVGP